MSEKLRIIFMGTPEFALPSLEVLKHHEIVAVVTQVDKPKGRGLKFSLSPVKEWAIRHRLPVLQPFRLKNNNEFIERLKALNPDYIVVASYGKILPAEILNLPKRASLNVHPSLLPKYRGPAPVPWTLINGEKETGVTIFEMDEGMDTGKILYQVKTEIGADENAGDLLKRLSYLGASALDKTIRLMEEGRITPTPQNDSEATYAPMLKKSDGLIDWNMKAEEIHNRVRGMNPWPGAFVKWRGKLLKVWKSDYTIENSSGEIGTVVEVRNDGIYVQTGKGMLIIKELQLEGRKRLPVADFLRGHRIVKGERL